MSQSLLTHLDLLTLRRIYKVTFWLSAAVVGCWALSMLYITLVGADIQPIYVKRQHIGLLQRPHGKIVVDQVLQSTSEKKDAFLFQLAEQFSQIDWSARPDDPGTENQLVVQSHASGQLFKVPFNKKLKLVPYSQDNSWLLHFSDADSPVWMQFSKDAGEVVLEMGLDVKNFSQKIPLPHVKIPLNRLSAQAPPNKELSDIESVLKQSMLLPPDRLLERYAGKELASLKPYSRLLSFQNGTGKVYFLDEEHCLVYDSEKGQIENLRPGPQSRSKPIAKLGHAERHTVLFSIWDGPGIANQICRLEYNQSKEPSTHGDKFIQSVHIRTKNSVSCMLNKKPTVLKKGDWLYYAGGEWRVVKTKNELRRLVSLQFGAEVFVIDSITRNAQRGSLEGYLFDPTHSLEKHITITSDLQTTEVTPDVDDIHEDIENFDFNLDFDL